MVALARATAAKFTGVLHLMLASFRASSSGASSVTTTRLFSCRVATSTLRIATPGTNRMLPSCSFEAASSEGSKIKAVLSLLILRMDLINAARSIFTTLSVNVASKVFPGLVVISAARLRASADLGREAASWDDSGPGLLREQVANRKTVPARTSNRANFQLRFMSLSDACRKASRGAMLRSSRAPVKGGKQFLVYGF